MERTLGFGAEEGELLRGRQGGQDLAQVAAQGAAGAVQGASGLGPTRP